MTDTNLVTRKDNSFSDSFKALNFKKSSKKKVYFLFTKNHWPQDKKPCNSIQIICDKQNNTNLMTIPPKIRFERENKSATSMHCALISRQFRGRLSNLCKFHFAFFFLASLIRHGSCVIASFLIKKCSEHNAKRFGDAKRADDGTQQHLNSLRGSKESLKFHWGFFFDKAKKKNDENIHFCKWTWRNERH